MIKLLLLLLLFSCSDYSVNDESLESIIDNLIVEIDRTNNELYIQAEMSSLYDFQKVDSLLIDIEYVGSSNLTYNNTFTLYDNAQNGDMIPDNGVYTLIDNADQIPVPDDQSAIVNIDLPTYFRLDDSESSVILFSITIRGKKYFVEIFQPTYPSGRASLDFEKYINIDNTELEVQINRSDLYIDNINDGICDRIPDIYDDSFYDISFPQPLDATTSGTDNYFIYESGFSIGSMQDCESTGIAVFKFILKDLDTGESVEEDRTLILYGCGDNICESGYESMSTCPEDCDNE